VKMKALLITTLYSPFQIDIANEFKQEDGVSEYHVAFTVLSSKVRGNHWQVSSSVDGKYIHSIDSDGDCDHIVQWLKRLIEEIKPTHIILGRWRGCVAIEIARYYKDLDVKIGYWTEPPNFLLPNIVQFSLALYSRYLLRGADYYFSIGARCENIYRDILTKKRHVYQLSYGQDLSEFFSIDDTLRNKKLTFLFSGQLIKRHNIHWICDAILKLHLIYPNKFKVIIAAKGPEQHYIDKMIINEPQLGEVVSYDREYEHWSDRIRPFMKSDVLIYPTSHSGWGLVIPEAMAAGMAVLSTRKAEAANYFLRHDVNGRVIEHTKESLHDGMEYCLLNRDDVGRYAKQARIDAKCGTASYVAERLKLLLNKV